MLEHSCPKIQIDRQYITGYKKARGTRKRNNSTCGCNAGLKTACERDTKIAGVGYTYYNNHKV